MAKEITTSLSPKDYVLARYKYLYGLKSHRFENYWKDKAEYAQANSIEVTDDGVVKYPMNTGFAISNAKVSEITASTPQYDFIGMDDSGRKFRKMVQILWDWIWLSSGTDGALIRIIRDAMNHGAGYGLESYVKNVRKVSSPNLNVAKKEITFEQKEVIDYEGCQLTHLSWDSVFINGSSMDTATEAIIIDHWDRDEFLSAFPVSGLFDYNPDLIVGGKNYHTPEGTSKYYYNLGTDRKEDSSDNSNTISTLQYYNKYKDEYIILANDIHINPYNGGIMPNPHPHKEIPIVQYVDHVIDGDINGIGEFDITRKSRALKDEVRSLAIDVIKLLGGLTVIAPDSKFDETTQRLGTREYARAEKDEISHFAPNISISPLEFLERKLDEDLVIETGVDFKGQLFGGNETAEKTRGRNEAGKKRINTNIKENAFTFYKRLARLRLENIKVFYKNKNKVIPANGVNVDDSGIKETLFGEYGAMKVVDDMLKGTIMLVPKIDSIIGDTSKAQKQKYLEMFQILVNLKKPDGTPLIDPSIILDAGRGIIDDVIDLDKILGDNIGVEKEVNEQLAMRGISLDNQNPGQPTSGGVPPAQQSGRAILLPSASSESSQG